MTAPTISAAARAAARMQTDDDGPTRGERAVTLGDGRLVVGNLLLQGGYLVSMLDSAGGVLPRQVVAVRLRHHAGVIAAAAVGNQGLVDFIHLVVILAGGEFVGHLLEDSIALSVHAIRIVIDGLVVEQVVFDGLVASLVSLTLHDVQLILGTLALAQLHIHLHALLGAEIVCSSSLTDRKLAGRDGLVGSTQQIEGLFIEILLVIQCCCLDCTLYTLTDLPFIGIVVEGVDIQRTG